MDSATTSTVTLGSIVIFGVISSSVFSSTFFASFASLANWAVAADLARSAANLFPYHLVFLFRFSALVLVEAKGDVSFQRPYFAQADYSPCFNLPPLS